MTGGAGEPDLPTVRQIQGSRMKLTWENAHSYRYMNTLVETGDSR